MAKHSVRKSVRDRVRAQRRIQHERNYYNKWNSPKTAWNRARVLDIDAEFIDSDIIVGDITSSQ